MENLVFTVELRSSLKTVSLRGRLILRLYVKVKQFVIVCRGFRWKPESFSNINQGKAEVEDGLKKRTTVIIQSIGSQVLNKELKVLVNLWP